MVMPARCSQCAKALTSCRRRDPTRQRRRLAELADLLHEQQPDALANVVDVLTGQLVTATDGPDERGIPLDEFIPRPLVAVAHARDQRNNRQIVTNGLTSSLQDAVIARRRNGGVHQPRA